MLKRWMLLLMMICGLLGLMACAKDDQPGAQNTPSEEAAGTITPLPLADGICQVNIFPLGKADCILVLADGEAMLIDAGYEEQGEEIVQYLKSHGVTKLRYAVVTHGDKDHVGGMAAVLQELPTDMVLLSPREEESSEYLALKRVIKEENLKSTAPAVGTTYALGKGSFTIYAPGEEALQQDSDNDSSLVLRFVYGERSFLFMGDALSVTEKELRESGFTLQSDVLKVGHHGKKDATKKKFAKTVKPEYAIICCGAIIGEDEDGVPDEEVMEILDALSVQTYRTDECGRVLFETDGTSLTVQTEP